MFRVELANQLPEPTTVHWHGIAIRNDMDGVPGMTQPAVKPVTASPTSSRSGSRAPTSSIPMWACSSTGGDALEDVEDLGPGKLAH